MPKFSIVIPVYNVAPYLRECLDSVLAQTFTDWEAICVDDGSTDGSGEILDEYAARFNSSTLQSSNLSTFRVVHQRNGGMACARNAGLGLASGDWLMFLDSDDVLWEGALKLIAGQIAEMPDLDLVGYDTIVFADGNRPEFHLLGRPPVAVREGGELLNVSELHRTCWQYAFRRNMFPSLRFSDCYMGEDRLYLLQFLTHARKLARIGHSCYGYRVRERSVSHVAWTSRHIRGTVDFVRDALRVLDDAHSGLPTRDYREFYSLWIEGCVYWLTSLTEDDREETWRYWLQSLERGRELGRHFSVWQKFTIWACRVLPFKCVAWVLGALPYRLKLAGFHR